MAKKNEVMSETADREIVLSRLLNAPRELVFKVWTDPKHVALWWGPDGFTNTVHEMDVRPGGIWRLTMHGPDGVDYPNRIIYKEVDKPKRLVYSHDSGNENDPGQFIVTVTFEEQGKKTLLTMRSIFRTKEERDFVLENYHAMEGGKQTLNHLEEYLAKI